MSMTVLSELSTPCLVLDRNVLIENIRRIHKQVQRLSVSFRPHVKTHKCINVADLVLPKGFEQKVTVSTLKEAAYFLKHGIKDILYAVGIEPGKLDEAAALIRAGAKLSCVLDDTDVARAVAAAGRDMNLTFPVLIELDVDEHRSGVAPKSQTLLDIADVLAHEKGVEGLGVMTHAGGSYDCRTEAALINHAELERREAVFAAERLREAGYACPVVSVGSTPTLTFAQSLDGVTEVRAGVFAFQDLFQAGLGVCKQDDIALSVLTTIIGRNIDRGWVITDAGWMGLSRDRGTSAQSIDQGYGVVCDLSGNPIDDLIVAQTNQEHGVIAKRNRGSINFDHFPVGRKLRILPNHACSTAAQHPCYNVLVEQEIVSTWPRFRGWS